MTSRSHRTWMACIAGLIVARFTLALLVIPPWQQPDEPQHLLLVRLLTHDRGAHAIDDLIMRYRAGIRDDPDTEGEIVRSMAAHDWWVHYGEATPIPPPQSFEAPAAVVDDSFGPPGGGMAYFVAAAWLLDRGAVDGLLSQLYVLRIVSALTALATLCCIWAGTRLFFGDDIALLAATVLALHPQFALVSTAANADTIVNLGGSVVWWMSARLFAGRNTALTLIVLWAAAGLAVAVKRLGIPLLLGTGVVTLAWLSSGAWSRQGRWIAGASIAAICLAVLGLSVAFFPSELSRVVTSASFIDERWQVAWSWDELRRFLRFSSILFSNSWLAAGWLRYPASPGWVYGWGALCTLAGIGCVWRWRHNDPLVRTGLCVALLLAGLQIAAVYLVHFPIHSGPQGRYLFPVLGPLSAAFCWGIVGAGNLRFANVRAAALTVFAFAFDAYGWMRVIIPAYFA